MTFQPTSEAELLAHYAGVRARLDAAREPPAVNRVRRIWIKPPPVRKEARPRPSPLKQLRARRRMIEDALHKAYERVSELQVELSETALPISDAPPPKPAALIILEVAEKHRVTLVDLRSDRRDRATCNARQEAFWRLRHETTLSLPQIGKKFGDRDHTTVLHGIKRCQARIDAGEVV